MSSVQRSRSVCAREHICVRPSPLEWRTSRPFDGTLLSSGRMAPFALIARALRSTVGARISRSPGRRHLLLASVAMVVSGGCMAATFAGDAKTGEMWGVDDDVRLVCDGAVTSGIARSRPVVLRKSPLDVAVNPVGAIDIANTRLAESL